MLERLSLYARLTRIDKPVGTLLLLWPTLAALWVASGGLPSALHLAIFVAGTFLMRSAGCAVNDVADRDFDGHVKRTAERVVASGQVTPAEALGVATALTLAAALLLLPLNLLSFTLAVIGVLVASTYPLFKRFFPLPQAYLAIAFSFGIPMAFAAVQGQVPPIGWWLFAANLFWVVAYDTEYAMVDRDDDLRIGVRSSAILFGRADVAAVMACYGLFFSLLLVVGVQMRAAWPYYLGWAVAVAFSLYHFTLIRTRERERCFRAFRHNQWVGFAVLAGIVASYALR
ncbi:MAG: 4-hydroxybenzoate octaprenyltransferase [Burkholderiaceae bacterium]|nr:4-hydroxybenzoate octaprenyltransferase [Burkholderiaceae bacterium]